MDGVYGSWRYAKRPLRVTSLVLSTVFKFLAGGWPEAPLPMCWPRNSVGRLASGSLICDYSGTCVGVLRSRLHGTLARHQGKAVDEETTHERSCAYGL